jgi:ribosomal protein L11 methyltransferase
VSKSSKNPRKPISSAPPAPTASYLARLVADQAAARRVSDFLAESLDPAETACSAFERPDGRWQVDIHFQHRPDPSALRAMIVLAGGKTLANKLAVERVALRNWLKEGLIGLRPVEAGRFVIHGAHDRARVPRHCIGIEIEAGMAFGTGHHGTTRGCLLALDALAHHRRPRHILDLGTGSGVLAIAAAKLFRMPVLAVDIDRRAVEIARDNARHNGVGALVTVVHAAGLRAPHVVARAPFDLVMANILLNPLQRLAAPMARQLMPNARVVLSGVLQKSQANAVVAAYRSQGMVLERSCVLDGWFTPTMLALAR